MKLPEGLTTDQVEARVTIHVRAKAECAAQEWLERTEREFKSELEAVRVTARDHAAAAVVEMNEITEYRDAEKAVEHLQRALGAAHQFMAIWETRVSASNSDLVARISEIDSE